MLGLTPLYYAYTTDDPEMVRLVLSQEGVDVNHVLEERGYGSVFEQAVMNAYRINASLVKAFTEMPGIELDVRRQVL